MEDKTDEDVQEAALQVLRNIYGKAVSQPVACAVTRWAQDPFSRGDVGLLEVCCSCPVTALFV